MIVLEVGDLKSSSKVRTRVAKPIQNHQVLRRRSRGHLAIKRDHDTVITVRPLREQGADTIEHAKRETGGTTPLFARQLKRHPMLLHERRRRAYALRRLASVGASLTAGAIAAGASAGAGSACRRMPRGRLAYQPS